MNKSQKLHKILGSPNTIHQKKNPQKSQFFWDQNGKSLKKKSIGIHQHGWNAHPSKKCRGNGATHCRIHQGSHRLWDLQPLLQSGKKHLIFMGVQKNIHEEISLLISICISIIVK